MILENLYTDIFQRLSKNEALTSLIGANRIFDYTPDDTVLGPYVVIGDFDETEGRVLNDTEREVNFRLHIWSSAYGRDQVMKIKRAIVEIFQVQDTQIYFFERFQLVHDVQQWVHGVLSFRTYIKEG